MRYEHVCKNVTILLSIPKKNVKAAVIRGIVR